MGQKYSNLSETELSEYNVYAERYNKYINEHNINDPNIEDLKKKHLNMLFLDLDLKMLNEQRKLLV